MRRMKTGGAIIPTVLPPTSAIVTYNFELMVVRCDDAARGRLPSAIYRSEHGPPENQGRQVDREAPHRPGFLWDKAG